jgi:hypothetical protein
MRYDLVMHTMAHITSDLILVMHTRLGYQAIHPRVVLPWCRALARRRRGIRSRRWTACAASASPRSSRSPSPRTSPAWWVDVARKGIKIMMHDHDKRR